MATLEDRIIAQDLDKRVKFLQELLPLFTYKDDDTEDVKTCTEYYKAGIDDIIKFLTSMRATINLTNSGIELI